LTPSTSRASSPHNENRKRSRLARGAKLNKYPDIKRKFLSPSRIVNSRFQQQPQQQTRESRKPFSNVGNNGAQDDDDVGESESSNDFDESESDNETAAEPPPGVVS
jgi:hypothetical protein